MNKIILLATDSGKTLADLLYKELKDQMEYGSISQRIFRNQESHSCVNTDVNNKTVVLVTRIQKYNQKSLNDCLVETCIINGSIKEAGAKHIINIIPYFPYLRQDRIQKSGECLSSKTIIKMLEVSGADKFITVDIHSHRVLPFFSKKLIALEAYPIFANYIKKNLSCKEIVIIAPDKGAVDISKKLAKVVNANVAAINKERQLTGEVVLHGIEGNIKGKNCILYDDIIDGGSTVVNGVNLIRKYEPKSITVFCTHAILSVPENLENLNIRIIGTDAVVHPDQFFMQYQWYKEISIAPLIVKELAK